MIGCSCAARGFRMPTSVPSAPSRHTGLSEIGVWATKRESVDALVQRSQGVYIVADDSQVVTAILKFPSLLN